MTTTRDRAIRGAGAREREPSLPWPSLLVLGAITFVGLVSEVAPAGLLGPIAADLSISESQAGLLVTAYALAAGLSAIPLVAVTRGWPRRRLLVLLLIGFALVNLATASLSSYAAMLAVRVGGGVCTGILWSLVGNVGARLVAPEQSGRALTIAMGGGTVGFSLGVPGASALGTLAGWRTTFAVLSLIAAVLLVLVLRILPPVPGEARAQRQPFFTVLRLPGLAAVAGVVIAMVVGHNVLFTYIEPFVDRAAPAGGVGAALLLFGAGAFGGMWITARTIDADLRRTALWALRGVFASFLVLAIAGTSPPVVLVGAAAWGLTYGGLAAVTQTAAARVGGAAADVAVSVAVTSWSVAIALGAFVGGLVLDGAGVSALPWVAAACVMVAIGGVGASRRHGFPPPS